MKNLFFVLAFMLISYSSFATANSEFKTINTNSTEVLIAIADCGSYARAAASAEMEYYDGSIWEWIDNVGYYFSLCNEAGGEDNILDPIFL